MKTENNTHLTMMYSDDVLYFLNSEDEREYLKKINYRFNSLEAAWIVYKSHHSTIKEKHAAWEGIIHSMRNCKIPQPSSDIAFDDLYTVLRKHIESENRMIEEFMTAKNSIYQFDNNEKRFSDYETCIKEAISSQSNHKEWHCCTREKEGVPNAYDYVYFDEKFEILETHFEIDIYYDDYFELDSLFGDTYYLDIPVPFQRGDLICCSDDNNYLVVFDRIKFFYDDGDKRPAKIYFMNGETGLFDSQLCYNYMDFEYYHDNLTGTKKTLLALSKYLKGEIDIKLFAEEFYHIINDDDSAHIV